MWVRVFFEDFLDGYCRYVYTGRPWRVWRTWYWQTFHYGEKVVLRRGYGNDEGVQPRFEPVQRMPRPRRAPP